jgi:16S rRNA (uracil1498-N3)-methyltransferase
MRIPRFYSTDSLQPASEMELAGGVFHHAIRVLRLQAGAQLILFDGSGREFTAEIQVVSRQSARVRLDHGRVCQRESFLGVHLWQGVSRGERMDYALQKAVELGVTSITPVLAERSQHSRQGERLEKRLNHWQGVIIAACEQCGRTVLPGLQPPRPLLECLEAPPSDRRLLLDPAASCGLREQPPPTNAALTLLIGPEGGLSEAEIRAAHAAGFTGVRLGPRILRTETATATALAAIQTLWGDLG